MASGFIFGEKSERPRGRLYIWGGLFIFGYSITEKILKWFEGPWILLAFCK